MKDTAEKLLSEFPEHSYEEWHAAAECLLKGAPFEKVLVNKTYEGITIQPIYRREDTADLEHLKDCPGAGTRVRGNRGDGYLGTGWEVSQVLRATTPAELNALIHEGLKSGQSELNITLPITSAQDVSVALDGVIADAVSIWWKSGADSEAVASAFFAAMESAGYEAKNLRGGFENDPIGDWLASGNLSPALGTRLDQMASLTKLAEESAPRMQTISVQGEKYHNAGATATQELGYAIATLVDYVEQLKARGIEPAVSLKHVRLSFAVGSDYFMEIAKLRAARWLFEKVAAAYGVSDAVPHIHAETSLWNKTSYDAHTNMLRVTSEAFAAVVAGVESLHIGPYDEISGEDTAFSRRISRNLHTILREECGLDRVIDPAGGSSYIEWLTDQVAAKSWAIFSEVEAQGGMTACVKNGAVQSAVQDVCNAKMANIRKRKERIVGANMYPDLKGKKLNMAPCSAGSSEGPSEITALPPRRAAEEYEALRDASAAYEQKTGAPPMLLQLNMGPSRRYRLRADWTAAFFEAAGFQVDGKRDFADADVALKALAESDAKIAVICSEDVNYAEVVESLAQAIKAQKPDTILLVAGAPGENEAAWRAAGVDEFVNVRSNNYELNHQLLAKIGVL